MLLFVCAVCPVPMRKLCPNYDREDGLDTVLEVPIPEEMFNKMGSTAALRWHNLRALMKAQSQSCDRSSYLQAKSSNEFMALLKLVGSPLISFQLQLDNPPSRFVKNASIVSSRSYIINILFLSSTLILNSNDNGCGCYMYMLT